MKCLNEEFAVDRCITNFYNEEFVDRIIVVDGGSTDYTREELLKHPKVEVFTHPWIDWYHDMEICQSNIALSYVPHGELCFILDFDERMSEELKAFLRIVNKQGMPMEVDVVHISRKTFELVRHESSPFAIIDDDGWPVKSHEIGQYPDFQCRLIRRTPLMHWVNSPHHMLYGVKAEHREQVDIIHYEKDDYRRRQRIERKWARVQSRRRELGLSADAFETTPKLEYAKYADPTNWKERS